MVCQHVLSALTCAADCSRSHGAAISAPIQHAQIFTFRMAPRADGMTRQSLAGLLRGIEFG